MKISVTILWPSVPCVRDKGVLMGLTQLWGWISPDRVLALIAIAFGLVAIYYEWRLHDGFKEQKTKIEDVVLSVHTGYEGKFPDNLDRVVDFIASLPKGQELLILVDFLGYGHYSAPDKYDKYVDALLATSKVRMLIYGEDSAKASITAQFQDDFAGISETNTFKKYLRHHQDQIQPPPTNFGEFKNTLIRIQDHFAQQITAKNNVEVRAISSNEAVLFWLSKNEMIFAFPNLQDVEKGFSFRTRDPELIEIFHTQFETKWNANAAKPVKGNCYSTQALW
jgi:hypothetical protein